MASLESRLVQICRETRDITAMQVHPASDATESICLSSIFSYSVTATTIIIFHRISYHLFFPLLPSSSWSAQLLFNSSELLHYTATIRVVSIGRPCIKRSRHGQGQANGVAADDLLPLPLSLPLRARFRRRGMHLTWLTR